MANLEIPVGFIEQGKRGTNISISAAKIVLDDEQKSSLSEEQRKILEEHGTV